MVIDITHASSVMYKFFFHTHSITWRVETRNREPNIFSISYMPVTTLISRVGRLLYYFQCTDMHTPTLSSRYYKWANLKNCTKLRYRFHKRVKIMTSLCTQEKIMIFFQSDNITDLVISIFKRTGFTSSCYAHKMCQWHQQPKSSYSLCRTHLIAVQCQLIFTLTEEDFNRPPAYVIR